MCSRLHPSNDHKVEVAQRIDGLGSVGEGIGEDRDVGAVSDPTPVGDVEGTIQVIVNDRNSHERKVPAPQLLNTWAYRAGS